MNTTFNAACCFNLRSQDVCAISKRTKDNCENERDTNKVIKQKRLQTVLEIPLTEQSNEGEFEIIQVKRILVVVE